VNPTSELAGFRGRITPDAPLAPRTWFRSGGPADLLLIPNDLADLQTLLRQFQGDITVLGACSNIIIRDGGLPGAVVRLTRDFASITVEPDGIIAGAAALDMVVAEHAADAGLAGLEFLAGIPGSIGGAIVMNAGAYGSDIATVLDWAEIVTREGQIERLSTQDLHFAYRHSELPRNAIVTRARLHAKPADKTIIKTHIAEIKASREASQPIRARTGGSTFRNPDGHKAWQLIDQAGCRGLIIGGAQISEKHCNFMINHDNASSTDLETLGDTVRARVLAQSGIDLHWEIKRLGRTA